MDGYTVISNVLVAILPKLIWPIVVIWIFFVLKGHIISLIDRIKEVQWGNLTVKAGEAAPQKQGIRMETGAVEPLSNDAKAVLSTLWNHQQQYYKDDHTKGRWSFGVMMGGSPLYIKYLRGVCELMGKGLAGISPQNGQSLLTDEGIQFCQNNPAQILTDWDFQRWKTA